MNTFDFTFTVRAPLAAVAEFHRDPGVLKKLTMPPIAIEVHEVQPLAENSTADFTLWMGPLPIRWRARHTGVDPLHGFRDTQVHGPMKRWVHDHAFSDEGDSVTRIHEHIAYEHYPGFRGVLTRLLFPRIGLLANFCYRRSVTRAALETQKAITA